MHIGMTCNVHTETQHTDCSMLLHLRMGYDAGTKQHIFCQREGITNVEACACRPNFVRGGPNGGVIYGCFGEN